MAIIQSNTTHTHRQRHPTFMLSYLMHADHAWMWTCNSHSMVFNIKCSIRLHRFATTQLNTNRYNVICTAVIRLYVCTNRVFANRMNERNKKKMLDLNELECEVNATAHRIQLKLFMCRYNGLKSMAKC